MLLSVIIPTHGRPAMLSDCLKSMAEARVPQDGWEVVVIDDGSDPPAEVPADLHDRLPLRVIAQPQRGLNAARNHGIVATRGEVIAFLDDDTLVSESWGPEIVNAFDGDASIVGGRVLLLLELGANLPGWLSEIKLGYLSSYDLGPESKRVEEGELPVGANFAIRRSVIESLGGFDETLGGFGEFLGRGMRYNDETEVFRAALDSGRIITYWPAAVVDHRIPPDRLTKDWFRRRAHAQGASDVMTSPPAGPFPLALARELVRAGRAVPIFAKRVMQRRDPYEAWLWIVSCCGRIGELVARRVRA